MTVAVVIPFRPEGCEHRARHVKTVADRYRSDHGWDVTTADCDGRWSKGAAVVSGVAQTAADTLVIADADSFTDTDTINEAARIVEAGEAEWVVPHAKVYRQTCQGTQAFYDGHPPSKKRLNRATYDAVWGGGITVISRTTYERVPIDPRFYDWGGEDFCWAWALRTLVGEPIQLGGDLFHLWHPHPSPNYDKPPESVRLKDAYLTARWHPGLMRAVMAGEPYNPPEPLDAPRRFRTARPNRTINVGPWKARFHNHAYETRDPDMAEAVLRFANVEEVTE